MGDLVLGLSAKICGDLARDFSECWIGEEDVLELTTDTQAVSKWWFRRLANIMEVRAI